MEWAYYNQTRACTRACACTHARTHTQTQDHSRIHTVLVEKPQGKKTCQRFGHRYNSIKINLTQIGSEDMNWIYPAKRPMAQKTVMSHSRLCISWPARWPYISEVSLFFLGVSYNVVLQGPSVNFMVLQVTSGSLREVGHVLWNYYTLRIWGVVLRYSCVEHAGCSGFLYLLPPLVMSCGDSLFGGCGNSQIWLFTLV